MPPFCCIFNPCPDGETDTFLTHRPPQRQVFNFRLPRLNGRNRGVCSSHLQTVSFLGFAHLHLVVAKIRKRHIYVSAEMYIRPCRDEYTSLPWQKDEPVKINIRPCQDKYTSLPRLKDDPAMTKDVQSSSKASPSLRRCGGRTMRLFRASAFMTT